MNAKQIERINRLMPDGKPRYVRCYDNGGRSMDRYTVVYTGRYKQIGVPAGQYKKNSRYFEYIGMSAHPFQGFGQHGEHTQPIDRPSYSHLGKKISFDELPEDCKQCVLQDYKDNWNI